MYILLVGLSGKAIMNDSFISLIKLDKLEEMSKYFLDKNGSVPLEKLPHTPLCTYAMKKINFLFCRHTPCERLPQVT